MSMLPRVLRLPSRRRIELTSLLASSRGDSDRTLSKVGPVLQALRAVVNKCAQSSTLESSCSYRLDQLQQLM